MILDKYRVYQSTSLEEIRRLTSEKFQNHRIELANLRDSVRATHNSVQLNNISIHAIQYEMECQIRCDPLEQFYLVVLPLNGSIRMLAGNSDKKCDVNSGVIIPNDLRFQLYWERDATAVVLRIEKQRLELQLASYLGFAVERRVRFDPWIDTQNGAGAFLRAILLVMAEQLDRNPWASLEPILSNEFAETLMATLLYSNFHNYRHLVNAGGNFAIPTLITKAMSYIRMHIKDSIQISDIAKATGVSPRALQSAFQKHFKMSPMHFVRAMRLAEVRRELTDSEKSDSSTITQIAQKWGFNHLGRFSAYYRQTYNESPSDSMK